MTCQEFVFGQEMAILRRERRRAILIVAVPSLGQCLKRDKG
jgi:hypothetical protein